MVSKKLNRNLFTKEWLWQDYERNKFNIMLGGWTAFIAHPAYYLFCTLILTGYYDSPFFRFGSAIISLPLMLESLWPPKAKLWINLYWYAWITFVLPISFTFIFAMNNLAPMWIVCEVMMIFVALIFTGNFTRVLLITGIGIPIGYMCFHWYTGHTLSWMQGINAGNHPLWHLLVPLPVAFWCGIIFTFGARKALVAIERNKATLALAGSIAHEMRNPLSQIKSSLDGIEKNLPLPTHNNTSALVNLHSLKNLYEYVSVGGIAIKRGLQVISMILDEVKEKSIDPHTFNYLHAAQATQKAIDEYGYETESERSKIALEIKNNFVFKGDETLFLFVLFNLIKNALYYFKVKPHAKISITIDQHQIIVHDTGPGIPSDRLPYLFDSFQTSGKQGGTGLGLSYCKRVMQSFGGDIHCQSMLGEYTEFVLDFPQVPSEVWRQYQHNMIERLRPILYGRRVLIVDDDETIRASTQVILNDIGIHSTCAENGQVALEKLAQSPFDLIILDLNMPVLDGYATAEKIRSGAIPGYEQIPIIAYTTEVAYMAKVKTQKVGIHTFVSKPYEPLILLQTMEIALTHAIPLNHTKNKYASLTGKTVLIADDSEASRKLLSKMLEEYGVRTLEAEHGAAVCKQLESINVCDAVLMDLYMPGLDGLEATRQIRRQPNRYQSIPIILITGETNDANITQAREVGVTDYITKPIEINLLLEKLLDVCTEKQTYADTQAIPLFNLEKLAFFKSTGIFKHGSDNSFAKQTKEHLLNLEQSIRHNDFKKMKDALHFLKGSSWTVGALAFAELIKNYEHQINNGQLPKEKDWFEKIKDLHAQTLITLKTYFD